MPSISSLVPRDAADDAAQAAFRESLVEIWTLFAVAVCVTILRTYARVNAVGLKNLRADDYLIWVGVTFYAVQSTVGYHVGKSAHGLANNAMTDAQRAALSPDDPEYNFRVMGSKIQVAGWTVYSALIWSLKLSILSFYIRLTDGLSRRYRISIYIGFGLVVGTFLAAILTIFLGCRPFNHYWQINPDPGNSCQAAVSLPIVWASFAANVSTDIYLILIPIPMLWKSTLRLYKKIASTVVFGAGLFILVCAILKTAFVLVEPVSGAQRAAAWGIREAFVGVITTNLPMIFPLIRSLLRPIFGRALGTSNKPSYKYPSGLKTIGGGGGPGGNYYSRARRRQQSASDPITMDSRFSEEPMVENMRMHDMQAFVEPGPGDPPSTGIMVSNQVEVTREDSRSQHS